MQKNCQFLVCLQPIGLHCTVGCLPWGGRGTYTINSKSKYLKFDAQPITLFIYYKNVNTGLRFFTTEWLLLNTSLLSPDSYSIAFSVTYLENSYCTVQYLNSCLTFQLWMYVYRTKIELFIHSKTVYCRILAAKAVISTGHAV
jgi:hypothetical protein